VIDEILDKAFTKLQLVEIGKDGNNVYSESKPFLSQITEAKDQIYKAVMEVIDTDIEITEAFSDHISNHLTPTDMLKVVELVRQTQRQRANKFFGRDK